MSGNSPEVPRSSKGASAANKGNFFIGLTFCFGERLRGRGGSVLGDGFNAIDVKQGDEKIIIEKRPGFVRCRPTNEHPGSTNGHQFGMADLIIRSVGQINTKWLEWSLMQFLE
jgi:hypothetical protein